VKKLISLNFVSCWLKTSFFPLQEYGSHITFASHVFKRKQHESECAKCEQSWALWCLCYEEQQLAPLHAED